MSENNSDKSFVPIRVSTLRGDQKIDFDAYIKINEKQLLYLKKGDSFEGERLVRLKAKKLKKMFILDKDEENYRTYLARNIEMAYDKSSGRSIENRSAIAHGAQQSHSEAVMENPEDAKIYSEAKDSIGRFSEFLKNEDSAFAHVMSIENSDQSIAHHGAAVATLAVSLARKLGFNDTKQVQLLALGSLLHDIEHMYSGLNVARPINQFTQAEMDVYKKHPLDGGRRVQDKKHFDALVVSIIAQHEEFVDGKGFPLGLPESKLDPMSVIVSSCNALDRMIAFEGAPKKTAARQLIINAVGRYPLQHLQLLSELMSSLKT